MVMRDDSYLKSHIVSSGGIYSMINFRAMVEVLYEDVTKLQVPCGLRE